MHLLEHRSRDNIDRVGETHGIPGVRLDGNDVEAVYRASVDAVSRARGGHGPTLLECRTSRWRGHVGPAWDLDVGVKRRDELKEWQLKDPVTRARARLLELGAGVQDVDEWERGIRTEVEQAVILAREAPYPDESDLLAYVYRPSEEPS
jgi:pyruvate dehydrogenase E1 component alpha subunit